MLWRGSCWTWREMPWWPHRKRGRQRAVRFAFLVQHVICTGLVEMHLGAPEAGSLTRRVFSADERVSVQPHSVCRVRCRARARPQP